LKRYELVTGWQLGAPIERVWQALVRPQDWPRWWRYVKSAVLLEPGDANGIGARTRYTWSSRLPYTLSFEMRTTRASAPLLLEGEASGDLQGTGRWQLAARGDVTHVFYDWRVGTTSRWMNLLSPLLAPVFAWNHDQVMREGGRGLARHLGAWHFTCVTGRAASHATLFG
jgi:uncharacterized protein YndB with AHSA1/START domain